MTKASKPAPQEHPRARGENFEQALCVPIAPGTSPRTRGKRWASMVGIKFFRNIPAHAGKTPKVPLCSWSATEHPRARGENLSGLPAKIGLIGTSPRTRGKRQVGLSPVQRDRNIPAHAGKTAMPWANALPTAEHPRARGENANSLLRWLRAWGTSPRTRGKR